MAYSFEPVSEKDLLALQIVTTRPEYKGIPFYDAVASAVSELIERRKQEGNWKGLADDDV